MELKDIFEAVEVFSYRNYILNNNSAIKYDYAELPKVNWYISTLIWKGRMSRSKEIIGEYACECIWDLNKNDKVRIGFKSGNEI
jgi:hypothetical protein